MRICHFVASTGLGRGDAFVELVNALGEMAEVSLVAPRGSRFIGNVSEKIEIVEYGSRNSRNNPLLYLELYRLCRNLRPDIVHTHFAKAAQIFHRLNWGLKLQHVATKHNPRKGKIFEKLPHVIAVSEGVKNSLNNSATVIYNGIRPVPLPARAANEKFTIRAIGRLDKVKGFDRLIREVKQLDFDFILEIVGEGEERPVLENLIAQEELNDKVKLLGFRNDVPALINSADLQVMSSRSEGFSLAMIEAIFYGQVFISTKVAGCIEILPEAFLVDEGGIAEKIAEVHREYQHYRQLFSEQRDKYRKLLNSEATALTHLDYYRGVLAP